MRRDTAPKGQWARMSRVFAARSVSPRSLGTRQPSGGGEGAGAVPGVVIGARSNHTVTVVFSLIVSVQVVLAPARGQWSPQLSKTEPVAGVAVSVIDVPTGKLAKHDGLHVMPSGALVTVPDPPP